MEHYNCIYMYVNKINGKKYIGQAQNFTRRHKEHQWSSHNEADSSYDYPFHKAIRKYGIDGFDIVILKENIETREMMDYYEKLFIKEHDCLAKDSKGYNVSEGGKGGNKFAGRTEEQMNETRLKMRESSKGEKSNTYGKPRSEKIKQEQAQRMKGNTYTYERTNETKKKLSNSRKQWVYQYDLQGNLLVKWKFATHAAKELGFSARMINQCCNGEVETYRGYIWVRK